MSDIEEEIDDEINSFKEQLKNMPVNIHLFSLSMRSLYDEAAVGNSTEAARKFQKIWDDTRQEALVYSKCILPFTTKFIESIQDYFEKIYEALTFEEWKRKLLDILEETRRYKEVAETALKMHEGMFTQWKQRQDQAKEVMTEFKDLQVAFEKEKNEFEERASSKQGWAWALAFVPGVSGIAVPLLTWASQEDMLKAIAKRKESQFHGTAALIVAETLIPALSHFIERLAKAAKFFQLVERKLQSLEYKADKGLDSSSESERTRYFEKMSVAVGDIKSLCQSFYQVIPAVREDFNKIPTKPEGEDYVDRWLKKQLAETEKNKSKVIKYLSEILEIKE